MGFDFRNFTNSECKGNYEIFFSSVLGYDVVYHILCRLPIHFGEMEVGEIAFEDEVVDMNFFPFNNGLTALGVCITFDQLEDLCKAFKGAKTKNEHFLMTNGVPKYIVSNKEIVQCCVTQHENMLTYMGIQTDFNWRSHNTLGFLSRPPVKEFAQIIKSLLHK